MKHLRAEGRVPCTHLLVYSKLLTPLGARHRGFTADHVASALRERHNQREWHSEVCRGVSRTLKESQED